METPEGKKEKPPEGNNGGGESKSKRKMKTPAQLEVLEETYAAEAYPSEAIREELSVKLGLTDRQLQMWFCHRRLKDKKRLEKDTPLTPVMSGDGIDEMKKAGELGNRLGSVSGSVSGSSPYEQWKIGARKSGGTTSRTRADVPMVKRYYESPESTLELKAIAFVEAQLGEPLREDGPILGMEFDTLPRGSFDASIAAITGQQQQDARRPYNGKMHDQLDDKSVKVGSRAPHEYQFLPQQPSAGYDTDERVDKSEFYSSLHDAHRARGSSFSDGGTHLLGKGRFPSGSRFHGHILNAAGENYDSVPHLASSTNERIKVEVASRAMLGVENPLLSSERWIAHDEDPSQLGRKRKIEEARITKDVEGDERRMRKELEKQDILRRKREEQMRREMERQERERRKEEERLMRERQREQERFQKEQRRELERRERFLQKENLRVVKMQQKEELRREKEEARLKAANERATARRIAKESMELIEDERLELMELAASGKGLPSIVALDSEALRNLHLFRDMMCTFPPDSVQLRRPFVIQPWRDSEENVGNLLMVWRFLITFADVFELWPFTLDEFVQAFHDYDPRLFGEIHVALLRSIIKDIEDVARTTSFGLGANQNSSTNPGGGHPQIVEGAYAWGFDLRNWQRHLNQLTWPEILRQLALSAGFGPQLKKRSVDRPFCHDDNEGFDCHDVVSTLRSGAAASSAAAMMQEKGSSSHPRRSRHRLTPGTVKFAAFHVLSIEGSKGLTILEVADKIQKSGLRDLTTSKTPEASIGAALCRDSDLFERTAPSTYCLRAAYRKDPNDAEAILSAAREKVQIFEYGFSDSEEALKDIEYVERDDDSECDVAEDSEIHDICMTKNQTKEGNQSTEIEIPQSITSEKEKSNNICNEVGEILQSGPSSLNILLRKKEISNSVATIDYSVDVAKNSNKWSNTDPEDEEIDESDSGATWVQGLMEGEYSDLSVEERLNALVALVGLANEGNSIRAILEERLEAANALKKQMLAEAQLDKRRIKEDYTTPSGDRKHSELSLNPSLKQGSLLDPSSLQNEFSGADVCQQQHAYVAAEKSQSELKSYIGRCAEETYVYRSLPLGQDRRRSRYWLFATSTSRNDPGCGRIFVESEGGSWRLIDSLEAFDALLASLDTRGIREAHLHLILQKVEVLFKESVRRNLKCKNLKDPKEASIKSEAFDMPSSPDHSIESCGFSSDTVGGSSSFRVELGMTETERVNAFKRFQDCNKWLWKECFNPSILCAIQSGGKKRCSELLSSCNFCNETYISRNKQCPFCRRTVGNFSDNLKFSNPVDQCGDNSKKVPDCNFGGSESSLPSRIRFIQALLALIEVSVPPEALQPIWTEDYRNSWGLKVQSSSSAEDLLQILTLLESAVKVDYLSLNFETTKELLCSSIPSKRAVDDFSSGSVPTLPWVPQTTAAVALRLLELDASICYTPQQKAELDKKKEKGEFTKLSSDCTMIKNIQESEPANTQEQNEYLREDIGLDSRSGWNSSGRGRVARARCGRSQSRGGRLPRSSIGPTNESGLGIATRSRKMGQGLGRTSRTRGRGRTRGRWTTRSRQTPSSEKKVAEKKVEAFGQFRNTIRIPKQQSYIESSRSLGEAEREWEETRRRMQLEEEEDNSNTEESSEESDGMRNEYNVQRTDYRGMLAGRTEDLTEESNEEEEEDLDNEYRDVGHYEERYVEGEDVDMENGYVDEEVYVNGNNQEDYEDDEENSNADEDMASESSEYSD